MLNFNSDTYRYAGFVEENIQKHLEGAKKPGLYLLQCSKYLIYGERVVISICFNMLKYC